MRQRTNGLIRLLPVILLAGVATAAFNFSVAAGEKDESAEALTYWPQWRGPLGTGVAPGGDPPVRWSERENVRWKVAVEGRGHATPIVWKDRLFLTTAVPYGEKLKPRYSNAPGAHDNLPVTHHHRFVVLAIDCRDGKTIWRQVVKQALPHEGGHYTASQASHSPVTDGEHVFAYFGSQGLYCLDVDGNLKWQKDLGRFQSKHGHGEGSSPALYEESLIVNCDHEGQSFVAAHDKRTGRERWRVERDEVTSWATPIVVEHDGRVQVIVSGTDRVRGYDLSTGKVIWECGGMSANIVASPVAGDGMVFAGSSYEKMAMLAIRLDGVRGDVTGTDRVAWSMRQRTPYVPSPLLYGDSLFFLRHYQGILTRIEAATGAERHGPFRLAGIRNVYASPVGAAGRVYVTDLDGTTVVLSHDDNPRLLALNRLDEEFSASAAIVGDALYLRGAKHLYCLAAKVE